MATMDPEKLREALGLYPSPCIQCIEVPAKKEDMTTAALCRSCYHMQLTDVWKEALSWTDIVSLVRSFIKGDLRQTPDHLGPLNAETEPLVPDLLQLCDFGIIPSESQPEKWEIVPSRVYKGRRCEQIRWREEIQRPYLNFSIPTLHPSISKAQVGEFRRRFLNNPDIITTVLSENDEYPLDDEDSEDPQIVDPRHVQCLIFDPPKSPILAEQSDLYDFITTAPMGNQCVTRSRVADTRQDLETAPWDLDTWFPFSLVSNLYPNEDGNGQQMSFASRDEEGTESPFQALFEMRPLYFMIAAREWDQGMDLQKLVLEVCENVGLKRDFVE
ncbi:hypothetical protein B0J11DRAFT_534813 [Dendryphion nanum]|uniref:DUF6919 domain-containing protein n=1 Tax=Dendryphion nanum TaxID=256645 RepID=A0A9P9DI65_9PLEO|nr:hypothetical protein B0J11DRAFT_534813 [Dendryphion nanum]